MADINVVIHDNSPEVKHALENAVKRGLIAIGQNAVTNAQRYVDIEDRIDTGNMRRSITHNEGDNFTIIGTDVFYAIYQELGTSGGIKPAKFLTRAAQNHAEEYIKLLKDSIANA